jgi:N utilization substance protein B
VTAAGDRRRRLAGEDERSDARERALTILYEAHNKGLTPRAAVAEHVIHPDHLTVELLEGVEDHQAELDAIISAHARNWTIERMPVLDVNILRLALFELGYRPEVPTAVVIDEAVELAKRFSTDDSGRFVNGMLSAVAPQLRGEPR